MANDEADELAESGDGQDGAHIVEQVAKDARDMRKQHMLRSSVRQPFAVRSTILWTWKR